MSTAYRRFVCGLMCVWLIMLVINAISVGWYFAEGRATATIIALVLTWVSLHFYKRDRLEYLLLKEEHEAANR